MTMKKHFLVWILCLISFGLHAQKSDQAKIILNKVEAVLKKAGGIRASFDGSSKGLLLMNEENLEGTGHEKIFITEPMDFTMDEVEEKLDAFREIIDNEIYDKEIIKDTMKRCVPTYHEPEEVNGE